MKLNVQLNGDLWVRLLLIPFALFLLGASACELTRVDLSLADRSFDFTTGLWPARNAWWAETLLHRKGRDLILVIFLLSFVGIFLSFFNHKIRPWRWFCLYIMLAIALCTGTVNLGKRVTGRHSPWDFVRYGGNVPYTQLFEGNPPGVTPGRSFPAGHASGGYALVALYFALRDRHIVAARVGLGAGLLLGSLFGYAQMARGAHFLSHTIWSAAICWFVSLFLYLVLQHRLQEGMQNPCSPTNDILSPTMLGYRGRRGKNH